MSDDTLRDPNTLRGLLARGYEGHASALKSGDAFAARYHDRVAGKVRRRRAVRHTAITVGTLASVTLAAVGAQAAIRILDVDPGVVGPSPSSTPSPSWSPEPSPSVSPSPSPSPSVSAEIQNPWDPNGTYIPPLPTGEASGVITENEVLRLVPDATPPATPGTPSESVACGAPVAGTYADPIFDQASARIIKPDTLYPTFLDPAYVTEEGDVLLGLWEGILEVGISSPLAPAGEFFVAVSYLSQAIEVAMGWDPVTSTPTGGGVEADYAIVANQGVQDEINGFSDVPDSIKLAFGTVVVQNGAIVGHADLSPAILAQGTPIQTINESSASDGTTTILYDFAVGPLESVVWCGERPTGPVDAYAVVGVATATQKALLYSFIWAGKVEYL